MKVLRLLGAGTAVSLIFLASLLPVHAQQNSGELQLTTSPLPISLKAKPGETISTPLRIRNSGNQPETLKVGLMKFSAEGEDGKPKLEDRGPGDDYFDWVTFSENQFVAQPGEWKEIKMTIKVPTDAAFGYYYAVTFSRVDGGEVKEGTNKVQGGTAILVLLEVDNGHIEKNLTINSFQTSKKVYEFLPVTFAIQLENRGNIHVAPHGAIFIKRGNSVVATLDVNEGNGNILPGSKRTFVEQWSDGFPHYQVKTNGKQAEVKDGKQVYELKWNFGDTSKLRFGKYSAVLTMTYDNNGKDVALEAVVTFWVIPWRILGMLLVPLLIIILLAYLFLRTRRRLKRLEAETRQGEPADKKPKNKTPKPKGKKKGIA